MTNNVTQISDYRTEDTPTSNIFQTIEKTKADLEGETAEVIQFEKPEDDELSDEDIEVFWEQAVNQSFKIIEKSEIEISENLIWSPDRAGGVPESIRGTLTTV